MEVQFCHTCLDITDFRVENDNFDGLGYMFIRCSICHGPLAKCITCETVYSLAKRDHTNIRNHMNKHDVPVSDIESTSEENEVFRYSDDKSNESSSDRDDSGVDSDSDSSLISGSSISFLDIDYHTTNIALSESFTLDNLTIQAASLPEFGNLISNTYFEQEYKMDNDCDEAFGGIRGICWRSRYRLHLLEHRHLMTFEDTEFMFDVTKLLSLNTETVNDLQYKVMNGIADRTPGHFNSANPHVRLPKSKSEADRRCLTGQFGIFNNLPCPNTVNVGDHACMKLKDVLAHHLALGRRIQYTEAPCATADNGVERLYDGIHGCKAMDDLILNMKGNPNGTSCEIYYAWMLTWSDSFIRSYVKQKDNNVWMYTITLPDPNGSATSPLHTYCVAVGAGSLDHTEVIDWYANEVEELMKGFDYYCSFMKKFIHLRIGVVAALADRPEKAFTLKTSLLGDYGRVASWAAHIVPDVLADCEQCFGRRIEALLQDRYSRADIPQCQRCCQWNLRSESNSRARVPVPKDYPTTCCPNSPEMPFGRAVGAKYLVPVEQTFEWLTCAVNLAAHNVTAGFWNKTVMVAYLRSCSIATSVRNNLWTKCKPDGATNIADVEIEDGEFNDGYEPIIDLNDEMGVLPKIWRSDLKMNAYIDCCMHLIFHGIVAYCVERVEEFMKTHTLTPHFEKLVNHYMIDIQSHRLEWCKLKPFPKKQWLAENEIGLARLLPFVYGLFFLNLKLPDRCNTTDQTKIAIMQMFQSMFVMISILMSPRNPLAQAIEEHVKIFLSACHRYCRTYFEKDTTPFWANTGNFPTLLCLAEQRCRFGPVRLYWEGTREIYIQELKQHLVSMRRTPEYFEGKLRLMYKTNVMNWIRDQINNSKHDQDNTDGNHSNHQARKPRMYYQYNTLDEVLRRFESGEVLSGFTVEGGGENIMIAYGTKRRSRLVNCISISRLNSGQSTKCIGLAYVKCQLDEQSDELFGVDVDGVEELIDHYCLLLPLIQDSRFDGGYAVIYDDWDVGDEFFKKYLPCLCPLLFNTNVMG